MEMLAALADIEIATKILKEDATDEGEVENPIDTHYKKLKCDIMPIESKSEEYQNILKYCKNTFEGTMPKIQEIYRIDREGEYARYKAKTYLGNQMLLWHGSRLTNYVGIISQGLRIAPPEAPCSGYRFGKGIYFADIMSLSARYCRANTANEDFAMLLGEVALGKCAELARDQYMDKALPGTDSTKALGTIEPDPKDTFTDEDGVVIPFGKIVPSPHKQVSCKEHQYVVYDVSQAHLKYLLLLKGN